MSRLDKIRRSKKPVTNVERMGIFERKSYLWINTLQGHLLVDRLLWSWDTISVSLSVLVVIGVILWFCHDEICDRFNELNERICYKIATFYSMQKCWKQGKYKNCCYKIAIMADSGLQNFPENNKKIPRFYFSLNLRFSLLQGVIGKKKLWNSSTWV